MPAVATDLPVDGRREVMQRAYQESTFVGADWLKIRVTVIVDLELANTSQNLNEQQIIRIKSQLLGCSEISYINSYRTYPDFNISKY